MQPVNMLIGLSGLICALIYIAFAIPLMQEVVKPNKFYGVRFAKAFESEENWYKINKYAGKQTVIWSILILLIGVAAFFVDLEGNRARILFFALAPLIILAPTVQSYLYARKL